MPPGVMPPAIEEFMQGVTLFEIVVWLLGAFVVIRWGPKWWRSLRAIATGFLAVARTLDSIHGLTEFMESTTETLASQSKTLATQDSRIAGIYHETHKNDGSSIKDSGDRTELAVDRLERGMLAIFVRLDHAGIRAADNEDQIRHELEDTHPKEK